MNRPPHRKLVGRKILCSLCAHGCVEGTTQVCNRVVFQFCEDCWTNRRDEAETFMQRAAELQPGSKVAA